MTTDEWPFDVPPNTAAVTTASVAERRAPILLVQHFPGDGGWTFLDGDSIDIAHGLLITMRHVLDLDPSVGQLGDLPEGWLAKRPRLGAPWVRELDDAY